MEPTLTFSSRRSVSFSPPPLAGEVGAERREGESLSARPPPRAGGGGGRGGRGGGILVGTPPPQPSPANGGGRRLCSRRSFRPRLRHSPRIPRTLRTVAAQTIDAVAQVDVIAAEPALGQ